METEKTHMTLSNRECSNIVDSMEMGLKLLSVLVGRRPALRERYHDLRDVQIPRLKQASWYIPSSTN